MYLINLKKEIISEDMPLNDIQKMFKGLQDEELRNLVICLDKHHAKEFIKNQVIVRGGKK
jgi:hypothetical protein